MQIDRALSLVAHRPGASQLTVIQAGGTVIDEATRCDRDTLFMTFSAMKPLVSTLVHQLAELGELDLDAPISWLWPEFARRGKREVTVRHVLQHRSGLDVRPTELLTVLSAPRATRTATTLAARRPPTARPHYQVLAYGVVLGEVCRRVTGRPLGSLIDDKILAPLGTRGAATLGLPAAESHRAARLTGSGPVFGPIATVAGTSAVQRSPIASGGLWASSRVIARFYDALGANLAGHDVLPDLPPARVADMMKQTSDGIDGTTGLPTRWANGVQLGGKPGSFFGNLSTTQTFGHNGSNICIGWHDRTRRISMTLLTSHIWRPKKAVRHFQEVADAVLAE